MAVGDRDAAWWPARVLGKLSRRGHRCREHLQRRLPPARFAAAPAMLGQGGCDGDFCMIGAKISLPPADSAVPLP